MQFRSKRIITFAAVLCAGAAFACTAATGDSAKESGKAAKSPAASAVSLAPTSAVAVISDKTITLQDVDAQAAPALAKVRQDEYEARREVLDKMVNDEILAKEAAARK